MPVHATSIKGLSRLPVLKSSMEGTAPETGCKIALAPYPFHVVGIGIDGFHIDCQTIHTDINNAAPAHCPYAGSGILANSLKIFFRDHAEPEGLLLSGYYLKCSIDIHQHSNVFASSNSSRISLSGVFVMSDTTTMKMQETMKAGRSS